MSTLNDYKALLECNGELNYKADAGMPYKELYCDGYLKWLVDLCNKYEIEFYDEEIDWEYCNYIHQKQYELEKTLEKKLNLIEKHLFLNKEAVNEIYKLQQNINKVAELMEHWGICYHSDPWKATDAETSDKNIPHYNENIMIWKKKDFENIKIDNVNYFYLGGSNSSTEEKYNGKYVGKPQDIAEAEGDSIFNLICQYIPSSSKYFEYKPYKDKLEKSCGWEQPIGIKAIIKEDAIEEKWC